jgi:hypothetical protein
MQACLFRHSTELDGLERLESLEPITIGIIKSHMSEPIREPYSSAKGVERWPIVIRV